MEKGKNSGGLGILGLLACAALYLLSRWLVPSLSKVLLWVFGIAAAAIVLLVIAVIFFAFHKPKKTPEQEKAQAQQAVLKKARANLMELRTGSMRVRNVEIRQSCSAICAGLEKILRELQAQPEDISRARSFLNHSLPMLSGILQKYSRLEQSGAATAEVTEKTAATLRDLETAVQKQYANLFDDDIVDITAEMEVLTQLCRQKGLLEESFCETEFTV